MSLNAILEDGNISRTENITMRQFDNQDLVRRALSLADSINKGGNKDLAQLGDAVIKLALVKEGYRRHATRISKKASNPYLAQRGYSTGLVECVYKNPSQGNIVFEGPMASTVEAIIGAVFIDSDENVTAVDEVMEVLGISWAE